MLSTEQETRYVAPEAQAPATNRASTTPRNFWNLWGANGMSNLGDGLYQFALPLLAVQLTTSPGLVAGVNVMLSLAWPLFALQAGSIVDRLDRRRLMLVVNGGRMILLAALTAAILTGNASLPLLYAVALLLGIGETLMDTALTAIVPSVVPRERLNGANAQITAMQTVTNTFIGPPLAGFLAGLGMALATGVSTVMYAIAGVALFAMRGIFRAAPNDSGAGTKAAFWPHLTEGLRFIGRNRLLRDLTLFAAAMNILWGAWSAVIILYAVAPGPMGLSAFDYGLLLTVMTVGSVLGAVFCERFRKLIGTRWVLGLDVIGTAALIGVPALSNSVLAVGAALLVAGFGSAIWVILVASIRQRLTPNDLLGRVYSASRLISWGVLPLGALLAGAIAELWGLNMVFVAGGVIGLLLIVIFPAAISTRALAAGDA